MAQADGLAGEPQASGALLDIVYSRLVPGHFGKAPCALLNSLTSCRKHQPCSPPFCCVVALRPRKTSWTLNRPLNKFNGRISKSGQLFILAPTRFRITSGV